MRATLIPDQTADTLRQALMSLILDIAPSSGATIRVDGATAFQALAKESNTEGTVLHQHNIIIEVGRLINENKNPVAENGVKEVLKEILRRTNSKGPISPTDLSVVIKNINSRVRANGLSSSEILFKRNMISNDEIAVEDNALKQSRLINRSKASLSSQKSKQRYQKKTPSQNFQVGQLVFLRDAKNKNTPRDLFIIEDTITTRDVLYYLIRKLQSTLRPRLYKVLPDELIAAPSSTKVQDTQNECTTDTPTFKEKTYKYEDKAKGPYLNRPRQQAAINARKNIAATASTISQQLKPKHKHGWLMEDQDFDEEPYYFPVCDTDPDVTSSENSTTTPGTSTISPSSHSGLNELSSSDEENADLAWDNSPEQYQIEDPIPFTPILTDKTTRHRLYASSESRLVRSNAFRRPTLPPPAPRKSRIPLPLSPSQVDNNSVNDISHALSRINTQVFTNSNRPRRSIPRIDYRRLHREGREEGAEGGQRESQEEQERPRNHRPGPKS